MTLNKKVYGEGLIGWKRVGVGTGNSAQGFGDSVVVCHVKEPPENAN